MVRQRGKTIVQKRDVVVPVIRVGDGHGNKRPATALRGTDKNAPGMARVAGLHADAAVIAPQQLIVIDQRPARAADAFCSHDSRKVRVLERRAGQARQIERSGIVFFAVKAVRVGKVRLTQPKRLRAAIHLPDKGRLCAAHGDGQRQCCVVAGVQQHPVQQFTPGERLAALQPHARPLYPDGQRRDTLTPLQLPGLTDQKPGHDLGRAGNERALRAVFLV